MRNRSYRRFQRERTIARHIRDYKSKLGNVENLSHISDTRHPLDCGKPQCQTCCKDGYNRPHRATVNRSAIREQTVNA